jgi:hypothetical protein
VDPVLSTFHSADHKTSPRNHTNPGYLIRSQVFIPEKQSFSKNFFVQN